MDRKKIEPASIRAIVANPPSEADGGGQLAYNVEAVSSIKDSSSSNVENSKNNLVGTLSIFAETVKKFNTMLDSVATQFETVDMELSSSLKSANPVTPNSHYSKASMVK